MELRGKKVLVIGAAKSGIASALFLARHGAHAYLNDIKKKEEISADILASLEGTGVELIFGCHADVDLLEPQLLVPSPGVPLDIPAVVRAKEKGIPVISELELACRFTRSPLVVITGTNGKTTTTALTGQIFADAGREVFVGGNIGVPFISKAEELTEETVAVLEASSFQLDTVIKFKPRVAMILNITPDHLDRHGSLEGYIAAKAKIFANQDQDDYLILNWDDEETRALAHKARSRVIFFSRKHILEEGLFVEDGYLIAKAGSKKTSIINAEEIFIKGGHNLENALAAAAAGWIMGVDARSLEMSLRAFPGVAHRLEPVLTIKGVQYINDSKGTNPDASIKALQAYSAPIVLIAGGKSKGSDFIPFAQVIKERAKATVLVGQAAPEIEEALKKVSYCNYYKEETFAGALHKASSLAANGDIVLLSPACASFDMFQNYEQRGEIFKELVKELAESDN